MITSNEKRLLEESYQVHLDKEERQARANNENKYDEIRSESDNDNPKEWVGIEYLLHGRGKSLL